MQKGRIVASAMSMALLASCGGAGGGTYTSCTDQQLEAAMTSTLAGATSGPDFTLMLERADGRAYSYSRGTSTPTTAYESASTSKLVTAVVILDLVDQGKLSLDSKPQDFIPAAYWPDRSSSVTLRHLLSFTSGFSKEPPPPSALVPGCLDRRTGMTIQSCVLEIYNTNASTAAPPGTRFYYSSTHLQIAGLMAINAAGVNDWNEAFAAFKARHPTLFTHSTYDLPSATNPRLAGGMHWTGDDYFEFLRQLHEGLLLPTALQDDLWANQRGSATVDYSPIQEKMGEDWRYGLGNWVECTTDCTTRRRNSSPGAYGAYPFIDFEKGYFGIVARQGSLGTFPEGIDLFRSIQTTADQWASSCGG